MPETNQFDLQIIACNAFEARIARARLLRGAIISDFAQVEYQLTDLYVRCWLRPEYRKMLAGKIPYTLDNYIVALKRVFDANGPIRPFAAAVVPEIDKLKAMKNMRDMLSHGLMLVDHEKNAVIFHEV